ncbi:MAG: phosphoribosylformylglycinamidine synthase subunit PurL [Planctomycetota bacterium]|nr:phosphoribosylformylglycinamidine synthase subunit PurL [Planctomycetota bacterium]
MSSSTIQSTDPSAAAMVHRFEIHAASGHVDPVGESLARTLRQFDPDQAPTRVDHASVYLIKGDLSATQLDLIGRELLSDPVTERFELGASGQPSSASTIEVHPLPGVTDPAAESVQLAIKAILDLDVEVRTGDRFDLYGIDSASARALIESTCANPVVHDVHETPYVPQSFPHGTVRTFDVREVPLIGLGDSALESLSREAHLFLDLNEMKAIQTYYASAGREPREIELETLAQTWSEHCVHKTLKATIDYREVGSSSEVSIVESASSRPHHVAGASGVVRIENLLKATVAAATFELIDEGIDWCLSVFVDNAGIIAFDDHHAVCFKVETHNHPSAIEPYGGAATGIGGCIRDIMGTGLAARPIAATDVFCVARPDVAEVPTGCLHPSRVLRQVVAGVRDYGNRMGIPTVNGAVWFDDKYVGNPLVYCGCLGVMPRDAVEGSPQFGDRIIVIGGRTGRDGIHGATFSSAELTDSHADEFSHAVQIGNPIVEKAALDAILVMRDERGGCLFSAITDCGAGGFSSAVGEMGEQIGARVTLETAPLKYAGLTPTETWISEAQERMVLSVPAHNLERLAEICEEYQVEFSDIGEFGTENRELILLHEEQEIGRLPMEFLHDGVPMPTREAIWDPEWARETYHQIDVSKPSLSSEIAAGGTLLDETKLLLSHPNIASKAWIIRQYDHEVQGGSVVKPLVGPGEGGPSDAAVVRPILESSTGLAIGNGLATGLATEPYLMGLAAIDECVRNLVCVGADPERIAILDNFCWPGCDDPHWLGSLVRAAEACYDGAKAYRTPFISGKDSLNNQFTTESGDRIRIPPTLLISGMGIVEDSERSVTMDLKSKGNVLLLVGFTRHHLGGSHYAAVAGLVQGDLPRVDLVEGPRNARAVASVIREGLVHSAHDVSDGGLLVAVAEMAFAGDLGVQLDLNQVPVEDDVDQVERAFSETPSRYLLEISPKKLSAVRKLLGDAPSAVIGKIKDSGKLELVNNIDPCSCSLESLRIAWATGCNQAFGEDS